VSAVFGSATVIGTHNRRLFVEQVVDTKAHGPGILEGVGSGKIEVVVIIDHWYGPIRAASASKNNGVLLQLANTAPDQVHAQVAAMPGGGLRPTPLWIGTSTGGSHQSGTVIAISHVGRSELVVQGTGGNTSQCQAANITEVDGVSGTEIPAPHNLFG